MGKLFWAVRVGDGEVTAACPALASASSLTIYEGRYAMTILWPPLRGRRDSMASLLTPLESGESMSVDTDAGRGELVLSDG